MFEGLQMMVDLFVWVPVGEPMVYLKSPSGKTVIRTDIKTARRIIRKRGWGHIGLKPETAHPRMDALKTLILGDKTRETKILYYSYSTKQYKTVGK